MVSKVSGERGGPKTLGTNRPVARKRRNGRDIIKILQKYLLEALRKTKGDLRTVGVQARVRATQPPVRVYSITARSLPKYTASHPAIPDFHTHHCNNLRCHTNKSQLRFCLYKLTFLPNQVRFCLTCTFPYESAGLSQACSQQETKIRFFFAGFR